MEHFERFITKDDIAYIAESGFDHVRLAFDQVVVEEKDKPFVYRKQVLDIIDNFISWCDENNLGIVLNLHKALGSYCDLLSQNQLWHDSSLQERFVALWEMFERRYAGCPEIAFELLNEPTNIEPQLWNDLAQRTIQKLRSENPSRVLIVGTVQWNSIKQLPYLQVFDDPNVIYAFHVREPVEFTRQRGVFFPGPCYYNRDIPYPGDIEIYRDYMRVVQNNENAYPNYQHMDINYLRDVFKPVAEFKARYPDKKLWCGEFGTIRHIKTEYRENWFRDVIQLLNEYDIPYCVWNYLSTLNDLNKFSLVDDDHRRFLSDRLKNILTGRQ